MMTTAVAQKESTPVEIFKTKAQLKKKGQSIPVEITDRNDFRSATLSNYIMNGHCAYLAGGHPVVYDESGDKVVQIIDDCIFVLPSVRRRLFINKTIEYIIREDVVLNGQILLYPFRKNKKSVVLKRIVVMNGDLSIAGYTTYSPAETLIEALDSNVININERCVTISYDCLATMFDCGVAKIAKMLKSGEIKIIDFTPDAIIDMTPAEKKVNNPVPPFLGCTAVQHAWHRPAWVLFQHNSTYYIMGMDEGSYFCSELPKSNRSKTIGVNDALKMLAPKGIDTSVKRQGEWFFVPVEEKDVPAIEECALFAEDCDGDICLPIDYANANRHSLHGGELRLSRKMEIFVCNPTLKHDQHSEVYVEGWVKFVHNRAVRSVSVEGVD